jgi:protein TorT
VTYVALDKAEKAWSICAALPHMKDAYWLGVDYGLVEEARRLGVKLNVTEAGGYTELANQISQIEDCVAGGADAVIIGAISFDGLNSVISEVTSKGIPVIDVVNGVSSQDIAAKALVSFNTMGSEIGNYLAEKHPEGSEEVVVGWFPGPAGAGWVEAANTGFMDAVAGSAVKVLEPRYGDTGKETQLKLVEDVLQANPEVNYIAGTAVTAEAAQGVIRARGLMDQVGILSFYLTHRARVHHRRASRLDGHSGAHGSRSGRPCSGRQGRHQACRPQDLCHQSGQSGRYGPQHRAAARRLLTRLLGRVI